MNKAPCSIPYTALAREAGEIKKELLAAVERVLDSGRYILGPEVAAFEREFAGYCQTGFAAGVGNGTCSLHLVLRCLGLGAGDEVITAPNSFIASASSIALTGARPVFADIRPDGNMDPERLEAAITPRTKAVIPVHLTGRPARMPDIMTIAKRYNLFVVEDAAQAVGARLNRNPVGGWGDAGCFSLHPLKNLHAFGDGGMMTTNNQDLHDRMLKARNHGLVNRERCDFWSFNSRLDEIHAAMLRVQLRYLDDYTEQRRRLALRYNDMLRPYVGVPDEGPGEYCVYQSYVVQAERRGDLKRYLNDHGVEALVHYETPIHLQPVARALGYSASDFPVTMRYVSRRLSLPLYPSMTRDQQDRIVELIIGFYRDHA